MNTVELELSDNTIHYYLQCLPDGVSLIPFLAELLHNIANDRVRHE